MYRYRQFLRIDLAVSAVKPSVKSKSVLTASLPKDSVVDNLKPLPSCVYSRRSVSSDGGFQSQTKYKVLYDGECPLCMKEIRFLQYMDKRRQNQLDMIDISSADYRPDDNGGISYETAMQEMHVIGPDNKVYTRVPAFQQMYGAVGLGWVTSFTKLPGMPRLMDIFYGWFAKNRLQWTGRQDCATGQ
ncbi:uncharacterized protein At5g50100, chloroplastic isoform X2 [Lingula anatina]|nr:uncharacterized protein At5g50100, chloroplastic isoform X2 [Lingula anatina]|eukprot:XP_013404417.1 uncharacterized protein At5g50100, chloroplastic isoform X2 [Lingula anatina]